MHVNLRMWKNNHDRPNMALGGSLLNSGWLWLRNGSNSAGPAKREDYPSKCSFHESLYFISLKFARVFAVHKQFSNDRSISIEF